MSKRSIGFIVLGALLLLGAGKLIFAQSNPNGGNEPLCNIRSCLGTNYSCLNEATLTLTSETIVPGAPVGAPYDAILCVCDLITATVQYDVTTASNRAIISWTCIGDTTNDWESALNVTNRFESGVTNGIGDSVTFTSTNGASGTVTFFGDLSKMPTNSPCQGPGIFGSPSHTYAFVAVGDMHAEDFAGQLLGTSADDGNNKTYRVCVVPANAPVTKIKVVVQSNPGLDEQWLPGCWTLTGGTGSGKLERTVDITKPGVDVLTATANCSVKTVTIIKIESQALVLPATTNIMVNADDDNENGTNDYAEPLINPYSFIAQEDDLIPVDLTLSSVAPTQMVTFSVSLPPSTAGGRIRVWPSQTRGPGEPLLDNTDWNKLSTNWVASNMPPKLWIEGVASSVSKGDVCLALSVDNVCSSVPAYLTVFDLRLAADANHDQAISFEYPDLTNPNRPMRFWINDDNDVGDVGDGDPDPDIPGSGHNGSSGHVNGRCDVIDFFPIALSFGNTLNLFPLSEGYKYKLEGSGVSFVYSDRTSGNAYGYLTEAAESIVGYGSDMQQPFFSADTVLADNGVLLNANFLNKAANNSGDGLILAEGSSAVSTPLKLQLWKGAEKLGETKLYLKIQGVEKMYRYVSLRTGGSTADPGEPGNYPDNICNGKQVIFAHGFSVTVNDSRAWGAETFKRLFQAGSRAMFTGVTWPGDDHPWFDGNHKLGYYDNVKNAFLTASDFSVAVNNLPGIKGKFVIAHSLGNMLVSSAIKDHGLNVTAYFALDAAVATEAYDGISGLADMINPDSFSTFYGWAQYDSRLRSTEWHQLFSPEQGFANDKRYDLTWVNRFGAVTNLYNFYSTGEDVLRDSDGTYPDPIFTVALKHEFIWPFQEMSKGGALAGIGSPSSQAGWAINIDWYVSDNTGHGGGAPARPRKPTEATLADLPDALLRTSPFFATFNYPKLLDLSQGSSEAANPEVKAEVLGGGIPALSHATGANSVSVFDDGFENRNYPLMSYKTGWPLDRLQNSRLNNRWLHSDFKTIANPFNHLLFEQIIQLGALK